MIRVPTEVVKQRSQTSTVKGQNGSWTVAKQVWQTAGVKGFYRGFGSTVAREVRLSLDPLSFLNPVELTRVSDEPICPRSPLHVSNSPCTSD